MPFNLRELRNQQRVTISLDDQAYTFVSQVQGWARRHPAVTTLIYDGAPPGFHNWGVTAAWNIAHGASGLPALYRDTPEASAATERGTVAIASRDAGSQKLFLRIHSPE